MYFVPLYMIVLYIFRLSTITNANRIICMDQGAIVEEGTHEELMKTKGNYSPIDRSAITNYTFLIILGTAIYRNSFFPNTNFPY